MSKIIRFFWTKMLVFFLGKITVFLYKRIQSLDQILRYKTYIFISDIAEDMFISAGVADELPLEEGNVEDWWVEVDELEDENLERQIVVEIRLSSVHF